MADFPITELGRRFDPIDAESMMDFYTEARAKEPIFYSPNLDMVVVTKYDDIFRIVQDTETFSSSAVLDLIKPLTPASGQLAMEAGVRVNKVIVDEDAPDHTTKRKALRPAFTSKAVANMVPAVEELVRTRLDRIVDKGRADLVQDLMWEVPALVVFGMFGLTEAELAEVRDFAKSNAKFGFGYPTDAEQLEDTKSIIEYWKWCEQRVERIFDTPGEDVVSMFIKNMRAEPGFELTKSDATVLMLQLLFAGHESTANQAGNMFRFLLANPGQWQAVVDDPSLVPNAVEECIRFCPATPQWRRRATKDTKIRDWDIPAGTTVMIALASANQDEDKFGADATQLNVRRPNAKEHLGFGFGRHRCLGEPVARLELQTALRDVSARLPHLRLVEGQRWEYNANTSHRGNEHVLVERDPARNPAREQALAPA